MTQNKYFAYQVYFGYDDWKIYPDLSLAIKSLKSLYKAYECVKYSNIYGVFMDGEEAKSEQISVLNFIEKVEIDLVALKEEIRKDLEFKEKFYKSSIGIRGNGTGCFHDPCSLDDLEEVFNQEVKQRSYKWKDNI